MQGALGERKLVAVVHADIADYSRLIGLDDKGTLLRLRLLPDELVEPELSQHGATLANTAGDLMLLMFPSITVAGSAQSRAGSRGGGENVACALARFADWW